MKFFPYVEKIYISVCVCKIYFIVLKVSRRIDLKKPELSARWENGKFFHCKSRKISHKNTDREKFLSQEEILQNCACDVTTSDPSYDMFVHWCVYLSIKNHNIHFLDGFLTSIIGKSQKCGFLQLKDEMRYHIDSV